MDHPTTAFIAIETDPERSLYIATSPVIPELNTFGKTIKQLTKNIADQLLSIMNARKEMGYPLPDFSIPLFYRDRTIERSGDIPFIVIEEDYGGSFSANSPALAGFYAVAETPEELTESIRNVLLKTLQYYKIRKETFPNSLSSGDEEKAELVVYGGQIMDEWEKMPEPEIIEVPLREDVPQLISELIGSDEIVSRAADNHLFRLGKRLKEHVPELLDALPRADSDGRHTILHLFEFLGRDAAAAESTIQAMNKDKNRPALERLAVIGALRSIRQEKQYEPSANFGETVDLMPED
ncbi:MAG: hypothetical protein JWM56_155 [Candidatus Peribacteria bacterium]|nr:hypothetical protein [Candidatus Peribacteria bacterium]